MKKINWKLILAVLAVMLISAVVVFAVWASDASPASGVALLAMQSDEQVFVSAEHGWVIFFPADNQWYETGFIFYPGGRVDYRAYAPVLRMIAERGYFVALVPAPLNLAFFDINVAARVQAQYPEIKHWVAGGHSLGGVAASMYAKDHLDGLDGLVFFASYPADDSLKNADIKVLSIYGTRDMAGMDKFDETKALLPADSQYVVIEGGNHAQFGSYGIQAGDNEAAISPEEQWTQTIEAVVKFLEALSR